MVAIVNHRNLQDVQKLPFCYSCGAAFGPSDTHTRDHVPARACFAAADRIRPLILPAHSACNESYKVSDERVGQLISLRHGRVPAKRNKRLSFRYFTDPRTGELHSAVDNVNILGAVERWVRAFHAALYKEPLLPAAKFGIETPFAIVVPTSSGVKLDTGRKQHLLFVEKLKTNRAFENIDRLVANNGKLVYECVWEQATNGNWICMFALDIYDWKNLGRQATGVAKGCVGFYQHLAAIPPVEASLATKFIAAASNLEPLDPFGT
jgi:hypothetical protein